MDISFIHICFPVTPLDKERAGKYKLDCLRYRDTCIEMLTDSGHS